MPNSAWTETGTAISLVPVTTPVSVSSSPEDVNYLTNSDKITLMAQYAAELATKTALDETAAALGLSVTGYNNAVAAISTTLVSAGAPSNWATTWPDGTTFGPVVGIQTILGTAWATVASNRSALQTAISDAQAAAAQAAAVSAAATDATNKMAAAISVAAPIVVSGLPTLPNTTYPSGKVVWNSADNKLYQSSGSAWTALVVSGSNIEANTITAGQIAAGAIGATQLAAEAITVDKLTVTNFTNLVPNPNCLVPNPASGSYEASGLTYVAAYSSQPIGSSSGGWVRIVSCGTSGSGAINMAEATCKEGDVFTAQCIAGFTASFSGTGDIGLQFLDASKNPISSTHSNFCAGSSGSPSSLSVTDTAPAGASYVVLYAELDSAGTANGMALNNFLMRQCADASVIVDGAITAAKISAGAITGDMITAGELTADVIYFSDGFCLNTLEPKESGADKTINHVLTSLNSSTTPPAFTAAELESTGISFSVVAGADTDVFNLYGYVLFNDYTPSGDVDDNVINCVALADGVTASQVWLGRNNATFLGAMTGLSAGGHTITIYFSTGAGLYPDNPVNPYGYFSVNSHRVQIQQIS